MKIESINKLILEFEYEELEVLFHFLHRIKTNKKKAGFINVSEVNKHEMELLETLRDILNQYFGHEEKDDVGHGGGTAVNGMTDVSH